MKEILPDIYLMEGTNVVNVYLLVNGSQLALIDTGMPGNGQRIVDQLRAAGFEPSQLAYVLVTHAHVDHIGSLAELVQLTGAKVAAHKDDAPYIQEKKPLPSHSWLRRILNSLTPMLTGLKPVHIDRILEDQDQLDILGGLTVNHTPGHSPGSVSYYQLKRQILFCGDAILNRNPVTGKKGLTLPLKSVTFDQDLARHSVEKLSHLPIEALLPGHGEPLLEEVNAKINDLLRNKSS
jgi:hydroxyacylglutathione hydrolase